MRPPVQYYGILAAVHEIILLTIGDIVGDTPAIHQLPAISPP